MSPLTDFLPYLAALGVSCLVALTLMPAVIRLARSLGAVDRPGGRRVHRGEIPRLGGIGLYLGYVAGLAVATLLAGRSQSLADPTEYQWLGIAVGMTLICAAGVIDDVYHLAPVTKLVLQILAAVLAVASGFEIQSVAVPMFGAVALGGLAPWVSLAWILLVINAMNLVDGLDGLAGGLALIITCTVASVAVTMNQFGVVVSSLALAGALLGFLRYNVHPARIFMGDGGSQFLGYVLAVISIRGSQKGATAVAILLPLLAMGLPIVDLLLTILRRAVRAPGSVPAPGAGGRRLFQLAHRVMRADRGHLHHNLVDLGLPPLRAVLVLYLLAGMFALSGYLSLARNSLPLAVLTLSLSFIGVGWIKWASSAGRSRHAHDTRADEAQRAAS